MNDLILDAKKDILEAYLNEKETRPWAVAWSGGKDSTTVAGLVISVLMSLRPEQRKRHIYFVMSDTLMENPILEAYMEEQRRLLKEFGEKHHLPITVKMVAREENQGYFYLVLGKGYPIPKSNGKNRWCTDKLKIIPQKKYLDEINPVYVLSGSRSSESQQRAKSIEKFRLEDKMARYEGFSDRFLFMPIVNFTVEDVWEFLATEGIPWGDTIAVRKLYKEATGECGFSNPKGTEGKQIDVCGARFGCWTCPVIQKDKSTEKMAETHEWLEPLTNWRTMQLKLYGEYKPDSQGRNLKGEARKQRTALIKLWKERNEHTKIYTKCGYMRNGKKIKEGQGTLSLKARKLLFEELLETEKMTNRIRKYLNMDELKLISEAEKEQIKKQWEQDEKQEYMLGKDIPNDVLEYVI